MPLHFRIEKSKSRSGKHAVRDLVLVVTGDGKVVEPKLKVVQALKPTYSRGEAYLVKLDVKEGEYPVYIHLVRNLRGHVKGYIEVYNKEGELLYRAVYRKLKLRYSKGDDMYAWIVETVANHLNLPVKRANLKKPGRSIEKSGR